MTIENAVTKIRKPRTNLKGPNPEEFQDRFEKLVKKLVAKKGEKPDMSAGYLSIQAKRSDIVKSLEDEGYEFIMQKQGEALVNGTLNSLINTYSRTVANTIRDALTSKLLNGDPQYVNFGSYHKYLAEASKSSYGEAMTWSDIWAKSQDQFKKWTKEFIEDLVESPTKLLRFEADQRGRESRVDDDLLDLI